MREGWQAAERSFTPRLSPTRLTWRHTKPGERHDCLEDAVEGAAEQLGGEGAHQGSHSDLARPGALLEDKGGGR